MSAPASSHAALRDALERELAAVLVDIARRPGRLVSAAVPAIPTDSPPRDQETATVAAATVSEQRG